MNELVSWAGLGTFAGAVTAVLLLTQFFKPMSIFQKIDTRLLSWIFALVILLAVTVLSNAPAGNYFIAVLNSVLVATSAMGAYEVTFKSADTAKKLE